jgi:membrane-associated tyrosine/threonine-specific cdc2-inhibitory kinase
MPPKSSVSVSGVSARHTQTILRKDEGSTTSESTNARQRRLRPMPDMSAFESGSAPSRADRSADDSTPADSRVIPLTNRLLCPPTPQRTPAWANEGGPHAFFAHRHNSLITTKVLLSCPSQVLEGRSSLENSILDDDSKAREASSGSKKATVIPPHQPDPTTMEIEEQMAPVDAESSAEFSVKAKATGNHISAPPRLTRRLPSGPNSDVVISFSDDFEVLGVLGSGAFADVYKVRFIRDGRMYAVKRNRRQFRGKRDRNMALAEVQSMQRLQNVCAETHSRTPQDVASEKTSYSLYVLFFYRAWQEEGYFYSQTELCCRDTCREMLDSIRFLWSTARTRYPSLGRNLLQLGSSNPNSGKGVHGTDRLVPNLTVWKICHDISAGLSHIHSQNIAHGDLKPSNIFFVSNARFGAMCKIGDFGMAGNIGSAGDGQEGDARYMSSELLASATRRASSDIFSLGLTLYEIATDEHIEMPSEGPRWHQLRSVNQPRLPPCRDDQLQKLVQAMTNPDETIRPTANEILNHRNVKDAGCGVDKFLKEYIRDVEDFDRREEERLAMDHTEDQTPRNGHRTASRRSPSLSMLLAPVPNLFSPTVVNP